VEHASDILGIYVNGTYLSTLSPMGTEIDGNSLNSQYRFPDLRPYLHKGTNVIAFRTEIWGHGSFMFPRGKLDGTQAQIPAVGFDSEKGLFGQAQVGWRKLSHWAVSAGLHGENAGYQSPQFDDRHWASQTLPTTLAKGDVKWYRTHFDAADLANNADFHAPLVLALKGINAKATIYLNGRLIGRWISDNQWLERGFWGRAQRDMWMNTSPDEFPIDRQQLNPAGQENTLAVVFEDTSGSSDSTGGSIDSMQLKYGTDKNGKSQVTGRKTLIIQ
jgi:hypothetical protein